MKLGRHFVVVTVFSILSSQLHASDEVAAKVAEKPSLDELVKFVHQYAAKVSTENGFDRVANSNFYSEKLIDAFDKIYSTDSTYAIEQAPAMYSFLDIAILSGTSKVDPEGLAERMEKIIPKFSSLGKNERERADKIDNIIQWNNQILYFLKTRDIYNWTIEDYRKFSEKAESIVTKINSEIDSEILSLKLLENNSVAQKRIRFLKQSKLRLELKVSEISDKADKLETEAAQVSIQRALVPLDLHSKSCPLSR